jgi:hypothetical protein
MDQLPAFGATPHQFGGFGHGVVLVVVEDFNLRDEFSLDSHGAPRFDNSNLCQEEGGGEWLDGLNQGTRFFY